MSIFRALPPTLSTEGTPVTLLSQARLSWSNKLPPSANRDAWFTVWFNSLRTSVGMYLHGVESRDTALEKQALQVLNLALLAPEREGLAPSIFYLDSAGGHWVGDQGWGGIGGGAHYAMFNNCWTGTWLLAWADLVPERREEILGRTRRLGDFLLSHQLPSGVVPSWFDPDSMQAVDTFRTENAETSGAALFLAELYAHTGEHHYLEGAEVAMRYLQRRNHSRLTSGSTSRHSFPARENPWSSLTPLPASIPRIHSRSTRLPRPHWHSTG